eukprot:scaffold1949_cov176-Ochromonas_danica.AAC.3
MTPKCPTDMFSQANVSNCMKGRTMYALGNSIPRGSLFNMLELLGGGSTSRHNQKAACPKHETTWGESCSEEYNGVKLKFLHMEYADGLHYQDRGGFPFFRYAQVNESTGRKEVVVGRLPNRNATYGNNPMDAKEEWLNLYTIEDACVNMPARACLKRFFANATKDDVLLFTVGLAYHIPMEKEWKAATERILSKEGEIGLDFESWLRESIRAFRDNVMQFFPGTVFDVSLAPMHSKKFLVGWNPGAVRANAVVYEELHNTTPWYFIDQWAINSGRTAFPYYNDHIHYDGPLSHATLYQMLNELCPGGGIQDANYLLSSHVGEIMYSSDKPNMFYFITRGLYVIPVDVNPHTQHIPWYFASCRVFEIASREISHLPVREKDRLPFLGEKTLLRGNGRNVYVIIGKNKRPFASGQEFMNLGFSFEDIRVLPDEIVELIPTGPVFHG